MRGHLVFPLRFAAFMWRRRLNRYATLLVLMAVGFVTPAARFSAAAGNPFPAFSDGKVHLATPFNFGEPTTYTNGGQQCKEDESNLVYVWGAQSDSQWANMPACDGTARHDRYLPWTADDSYDHTLAWYQQNHPDWVEYKSDRTTPAYGFSDRAACQCQLPLDITNPAVQQYILNDWALPALQKGYAGISFDNGIDLNVWQMAGHFDSQGNWVQQYSGNTVDSAFVKAQASAFATMVSQIKAAYPNASISLNASYDCSGYWSQSVTQVDLVFDEQGYTNWGDSTNYVPAAAQNGCSNEWLQRTKAYVWLQKTEGKALILNAQEPYAVTTGMTTTNSQARQDVQWLLANYYLVKYDRTYLGPMTGQQAYGGPLATQPEYSADLGTASGDFYSSQNVYMRTFSHGLAIVNPSPTMSYTIHLTAGTYQDLYGNPVSIVTMAPHSGLVLVLQHALRILR